MNLRQTAETQHFGKHLAGINLWDTSHLETVILDAMSPATPARSEGKK